METIQLTDANVRYHKIGKGAVLILIPGANGTGDIFMPLAKQIADHFTVIAVDRRGFGQSKLTAPLPEEAANPHSQYRVKRDAQDIAEIAQRESTEPVYVLGSSSGSIVAMHVLKEHPNVVKHIAFHEPPINTFLPDRDYWQQKNNEIVDTALNDSMAKAMEIFGKALNVAEIDRQAMTKPAQNNDDTEQNQRVQEMLNWFKYEIRQYTTSDIQLSDFKPYLDRITLLNGEASKGSFPQDVNNYIAKQTGLDIVEIPGGHLGYVQDSEGFAKVLLETWAK